jgi:hypothetical protein
MGIPKYFPKNRKSSPHYDSVDRTKVEKKKRMRRGVKSNEGTGLGDSAQRNFPPYGVTISLVVLILWLLLFYWLDGSYWSYWIYCFYYFDCIANFVFTAFTSVKFNYV